MCGGRILWLWLQAACTERVALELHVERPTASQRSVQEGRLGRIVFVFLLLCEDAAILHAGGLLEVLDGRSLGGKR
jgi:hypothetical protein